MLCSGIRPSAHCAGQMASRARLVSPNTSSSAALMTRNPPGSAMRVPTVTHGLMLGQTPVLPDIINRSRGGYCVCILGACIGPTTTLPTDWTWIVAPRSEEHTSELQSHLNLVC